MVATWTALFKKGSLSLLIAPTQRQASELLYIVHRFYSRMGPPVALEVENVMSLRLATGSRVISLPGDGAAAADHVRGFAAPAAVLFDEASRVSDLMVESIRPMLATAKHPRIIASSTPSGRRGWWFSNWIDESQDWKRIEIPAPACPRISAEFLAREKRELGERAFAQEYLCSFEENAAALFAEATIDSLVDPALESWSSWLHGAEDQARGAIV
ncbi:MAG TPA: terminase family protein [Chloroflexota bacterium]